VRVVAAGGAGVDGFILGLFTWALVGFANVYYGLALRVRDVVIEQLKTKTSIAMSRPMIYHPEVQHGIAEIAMDLEAAFRVADRALDLSGGFGMFKKSELERLFRDARAGRFHPANPMLTHEIVGKIALGINLDEQPRWG